MVGDSSMHDLVQLDNTIDFYFFSSASGLVNCNSIFCFLISSVVSCHYSIQLPKDMIYKTDLSSGGSWFS